MNFAEWYSTQKHQLSNEKVCRVIWDAATREEREACEKLAEGAQHLPNDGKDFANGWCSASLQIEQAVRMRSNAIIGTSRCLIS